MYWICLHHAIRQRLDSWFDCHILQSLQKIKIKPVFVLPTLVSSRGSQHTDWKLMGSLSAFQQKALYIDPFNLTSLPRNFVVTSYFKGDCTWGNPCVSFIILTSLTKESHLVLIAELLNSAWQLQRELLRSGFLVTYLHIHLKWFFRTIWNPLLTWHPVIAEI